MVRIIIALLFVFRLLPLRKPINNCPREPLSVSKKTVFPGRGTFASGFEVGTENAKNALLFLTWDWFSVVWASLIKHWNLILLH